MSLPPPLYLLADTLGDLAVAIPRLLPVLALLVATSLGGPRLRAQNNWGEAQKVHLPGGSADDRAGRRLEPPEEAPTPPSAGEKGEEAKTTEPPAEARESQLSGMMLDRFARCFGVDHYPRQ